MNETAQNSYENLFSELYLFVKPIICKVFPSLGHHRYHKKPSKIPAWIKALKILIFS